ncbi:phosphatase PAP2 family protein, partial [Candidatus Saccharibacteria bacterium]|nr:phosphatase PAP2 family protein [Candidatus Saccharibacteria bacterium]
SVGEYYASFPSGHTTFLAALGTASFFTDRWVGVTVIILALLTGMGRVLAGVHYPVDIVGGFLLGATVAGLAKWTHDRYPFW